MTTYFITRHKASVEWAFKKNINIDFVIEHLDTNILSNLKSGDVVIGILPINLVFEINQKGVHYGHFSIQLPFELRGKELSLKDIEKLKPTIQFYSVTKH